MQTRPPATTSQNKLLTTISTLVVAVAAFYFGANSVQSASRIGTDAPTGEQLAAKIRAALGGGGFAGVTVSVVGGGAVLMGTVTNEASKEEAERAARSVSGMDTVRNKLAVAPLEERAEGQGKEHAEGRQDPEAEIESEKMVAEDADIATPPGPESDSETTEQPHNEAKDSN